MTIRSLIAAGAAVLVLSAHGAAAGQFNSSASDIAKAIQDLYGNATNPRPSGNGVTPSLAPGPWTCNDPLDCSLGATQGLSVGEAINPNASFANRDDRDPTVKDFSAPYDHPGLP
jgi:hypothetical protein